ncbi:replication protein RepA (plasmid) [Kozakia baliensis]|uniref:replication protein RepA n=1 Tax=Kozakia baliensis TaxID=153496 RepID=UPI00345B881D
MGQIHRLIVDKGIEEARRIAETQPNNAMLQLNAAHTVLSDDTDSMGVTHAGFAMAALPHRKTDDLVWKRENGPTKLLVESGRNSDETLVGIPYGATARMILLYLQTQAVRNQSREIELGGSMQAWLTAMGLAKGGKTYQSVKEQAKRVSRCRLTFFHTSADGDFVSNGAFVRDAILPATGDGKQSSLWRETVVLDEMFYNSLVQHALPLRESAIREISNRSMAIDIYVWLAYRLHHLQKPTPITWTALHAQFSTGPRELRFFKRDIRSSLELALAVYPEAKVGIDDKAGLVLHPSPPPISKRGRIYKIGA